MCRVWYNDFFLLNKVTSGYNNIHWRRSAVNSAGAFPENFGEFSPIHILYYKISGRGSKSGGARAPAAPASSAPMFMLKCSKQNLGQFKVFGFKPLIGNLIFSISYYTK